MDTLQNKQRDHFVAQMYLKRFLSNEKQKLYVYHRANNNFFTTNTNHICCEKGWDIVENSIDKDILKKILKEIEPRFNGSVNRLLSQQVYVDDRQIISWYLGILSLLNPQYLKDAQKMHENIIKTSADILIDNGVIEISPEIEKVLGDKHNFKVKVDPIYIKNFMMQLMYGFVVDIYKTPWIIMKNNSDVGFLTSDNPIAFMAGPHNSPYKPKYLPLDAKHLLFLLPPIEKRTKVEEIQNFNFNAENAGNIRFIDLEDKEEILFNLYTIANADRFIILGKEDKRLVHFICKNKCIKTEMVKSTIHWDKGYLNMASAVCNRTIKQKQHDFYMLIKILKKLKKVNPNI